MLQLFVFFAHLYLFILGSEHRRVREYLQTIPSFSTLNVLNKENSHQAIFIRSKKMLLLFL
jgi:hypothetical protein